jgi:hypothetical protein
MQLPGPAWLPGSTPEHLATPRKLVQQMLLHQHVAVHGASSVHFPPPPPQPGDYNLMDIMALRWPTGESPMMVKDAVMMVGPHVDVITLDVKTYDNPAGEGGGCCRPCACGRWTGSAVQCSAVQCSAVQCSAVQCSACWCWCWCWPWWMGGQQCGLLSNGNASMCRCQQFQACG